MLELLMVALFQAVAGAPAPPSAEQPAGQEQVGGAAPEATAVAPEAAAAPAESAPEAAAVPTPTEYRRERRCREVEVTGRRMPQRVCQNVMVPVEQPAAPAQ